MSFLGSPRIGLGFGPSAELMQPKTPLQRSRFIHEAYGPRIDAGTEFFAVVPLDADGRVLRSMVIAEGTGRDVDFDYYDVERALQQAGPQAVKFFMVHNHPSNNARPSKQDIEMTAEVLRLLQDVSNGRWAMDDHIIVTENPNVLSSLRVLQPALWGDVEEEFVWD